MIIGSKLYHGHAILCLIDTKLIDAKLTLKNTELCQHYIDTTMLSYTTKMQILLH